MQIKAHLLKEQGVWIIIGPCNSVDEIKIIKALVNTCTGLIQADKHLITEPYKVNYNWLIYYGEIQFSTVNYRPKYITLQTYI